MCDALRERTGAITDQSAYEAFEGVLTPARAAFAEVIQIGPPRINAELKQSLERDMRVLVPASALLLAATVFGFYRSLFAAATPLLTAGLSLLWAFGLMGWARIPVNILCAMLPSLVVVIGATALLCLGLFAFIGVNLFNVGARFHTSGEVSATIKIPFYPVAYGLAICCLLECFVFIFDIVKIWRGDYE